MAVGDGVAVAGLAGAVQAWQTAWKRHNRWSADGTWQRLVTAAQARADAAGQLDWLVAVDSTIVRAHQHAATPATGGESNYRIAWPDEQPADHVLGRSRGGLTTKIHGASDGRCRSLAIHVTAGQVHDSTQFAAVLTGIGVPRSGLGAPAYPTATGDRG